MKSIVSRELSIHQEHELLLKLEQAGLNKHIAQKIIESKDNQLAKEMIEVVSDTIITVQIEAKSLLDLREEYGTGEDGFYDNTWWLNEDFAKDTPEPGIYEINIEKQLTNLAYNNQKEKLPEGWSFPHPAVITQAILKHYEKTGERLLEDWYTRTSLTDSDGSHVNVGGFASGGLNVYDDWDDLRHSSLGVAPSRKS